MREPDGFVGTETPADHAPRAANVPWMAMVPLIAPAAVLGAAHVRAAGVGALLCLACMGWAVAAMGWAFTSATPLAAIALAVLAGLAYPLRATAIQRVVGEGAGARAVSAAHACDMALSVSILPAAGWWSGSILRARDGIRLTV